MANSFFKKKNIFSTTRVINGSAIPYRKLDAALTEVYGPTVRDIFLWDTSWGIGKRKADFPDNKKVKSLSKALISGGCLPKEKLIIET